MLPICQIYTYIALQAGGMESLVTWKPVLKRRITAIVTLVVRNIQYSLLFFNLLFFYFFLC